MGNLLSTLFSSKEQYLHRQICLKNNSRSFPLEMLWDDQSFFESVKNDSVLISGGSEIERATAIYRLLHVEGSGLKIVIHNGNSYLENENMNRNGFNTYEWGSNSHGNMKRSQLITVLTSEDQNKDLAIFYVFAMDVCIALNIPISIVALANIDWLGIEWQHRLLNEVDEREIAIDLLARFDGKMAERGARAVCQLEKISRAPGNMGKSIQEFFGKNCILVKRLYGSASAMANQCFEILQDAMERGERFTLVLDDIYIRHHPLIYDNLKNVKLIFSSSDLCSCSNELNITKRTCGIIIFNHNRALSAEKISRCYIGEFDRLMTSLSAGVGKRSSSLFSYDQNRSISINEARDLRLKPEYITRLKSGEAFIHLHNQIEGALKLALIN